MRFLRHRSPESPDPTPPFSGDDLLVVALLEKARARRDLDILDAARRARLTDDLAERDTTFSHILATETIALHNVMMKLNRRLSLRKLLGRQAVSLSRGEVTEYPPRLFGNSYSVTTPVMLNTAPELTDDATIIDGYIFTADHPKQINPTVSIHRALTDTETGEQVIRSWEYIIHVGGQEEGHPFALVSGNATGKPLGYSITGDSPELEQSLGLVSLAKEQLQS